MINLRKNILKALSEQVPFDNRKPWEKFPDEVKNFFYGDPQREFILKLQAGREQRRNRFFRELLRISKIP